VIVVSDSSAIINLAAVGELELLNHLYGQVLIPQAVFDEIVVAGTDKAGAVEAASQSWIEVRRVADRSVVEALLTELHLGESEAIALAREVDSDLLLIDERRGRTVAARLGLKRIGLLGVLIDAKQRGALRAVRPVLDNLRSTAGFWIDDALYARVLESAEERPAQIDTDRGD